MSRQHPADDRLLELGAGRLPAAAGLVVAVHLEACDECRARLHALQALGGVLLEDAPPMVPAPGAWERTLARIDSAAPSMPVRAEVEPPAKWPDGVQWPASLRGCRVSRWRWMGPDMRFARISVPHDEEAALFLLRIGAGRSLPRHTHHGTEFTQVLCGSFDDGRTVFAAGDFDEADAGVHHQPVVRAGEECICLAYLDAPLRFDGRIAGLVGGLVGL